MGTLFIHASVEWRVLAWACKYLICRVLFLCSAYKCCSPEFYISKAFVFFFLFFFFLSFVLFCLTSAVLSFCCYMLLLVWCLIWVLLCVNQLFMGFITIDGDRFGSCWFLLLLLFFCSFLYSFVWFFLLHFVFVLCIHQWKKKLLYFCDFYLLFSLCIRSTLISVFCAHCKYFSYEVRYSHAIKIMLKKCRWE